MREWKRFALILGVFLLAYVAPFEHPRVGSAILEAFYMLQEYAREHVLFCLVPAFFIAGGIATFISHASVIKYFGAKASKWLAYSVASVSGTVLAVCSCTVLPLFAGIYARGSGIGPATAFLYSGPAINVLAILLTARVLGWRMGLARALGAIIFSVVIGLSMAFIFRKDEQIRTENSPVVLPGAQEKSRHLWQEAIYFLTMVSILVFAAWGKPKEPVGLWDAVYRVHWYLAGGSLALLLIQLKLWFGRDEMGEWLESTWGFAKQILPLLFAGVLAAGLLMGHPSADNGLIPSRYISSIVGGNSVFANLFASLAGALMYFATLTEIPILQGLLGSGMGQGPALALLLAGPALSLPNMLVIRSVLGTKKALMFVVLVVAMSAITGLVYGTLVAYWQI